MSTRGVTGFVLDGKRYTMYNHSDSYPEWLGQQMVEFCKTVKDWDAVKEKVKNVKLVKNSRKPATKKWAIKYARYWENPNVTLWGQPQPALPDWYWLLHNLQGVGILREIIEGNVGHMLDADGFLEDDLFCEWGYLINLDNKTLEVYHDGDKMLYAYNLQSLPEFMLGVTNEFKEEYRQAKAEGKSFWS